MNEPLSEPVAPASGFEREHQRLDRQLRAHLLTVVGADFSAAHDKLTRWQRALLRHIDRWAKPQRVGSTLAILPSESYIITEPLGVALIMAPWNYPFNLLICPLVGAISSGCCAVLKPSPYTPHTAAVMEQMISETFPQNYISVVQGDRHVNALLL